jgi:hypothetical protein
MDDDVGCAPYRSASDQTKFGDHARQPGSKGPINIVEARYIEPLQCLSAPDPRTPTPTPALGPARDRRLRVASQADAGAAA